MPLRVLAISISQADSLSIEEIARNSSYLHQYEYVESVDEALARLGQSHGYHIILWDVTNVKPLPDGEVLTALTLPIMMLFPPEDGQSAVRMLAQGVSTALLKQEDLAYRNTVPELLENMYQRIKNDAVWKTIEFERNLTATVYMDHSGKIIDCNQLFVDSLRYVSKSNIIGTNWADFSDLRFSDLLEKLDQNNPMVGQEIELRGSGGEIRIGVANIGRLEKPAEQTFEIRLKFIDITDWRQAEQELRLLKHAIEAATVGITVMDARQGDLPIIYVNHAFETITGYGKEETLHRNPRFLYGTERNQPELDLLRAAIANYENCDVIVRNYRKDGTPFWNSLRISPLISETGEATHFVGIQTDITAWREAQEDLARSQEMFSRIFHGSPDAIALLRLRDRCYVEINENFQIFTGFNRTDVIGKTPDELKQEHTPRLLEKLLHGETVQNVPVTFTDRQRTKTRYGSFSASTIQVAGELYALIIIRDVSEQRLAQESLIQSEERYRSLIESSDHLILMVDHQGIILFASEFTAKQLNTSPEQLVGKALKDVFPAEYARQQLRLVHQVIHASEGVIVETPTQIMDQWFRTSIQPVRDADGTVSAALLNITDITGIKRTEIALRTSESKLAEAQRAVLLGYWDWDVATGAVTLSDEILNIFRHVDMTQIEVPEDFIATCYPDDRERLQSTLVEVVKGNPFQIDLRVLTNNDSTLYVHARTSKILFDESGKVSHVSGTIQDITERKELENKLTQLNQELEQRVEERTQEVRRQVSAMNSTRAGMALLVDGRYIYMNPAHAEMYGYTPDELLGERWEHLYDARQVEMFSREVFPALADKGEWAGEVVGTRKDGSTFDAEVTLQYSISGELICTCSDITSRKKMEMQIRLSEARYRLLLEQAPIAMIVNDYDGGDGLHRILYANPAAMRLLGAATPEDLIGHSAYEFMSEESRQFSLERVRKFIENVDPSSAEYEYYRIDTGASIFLQVASIVIDFGEQSSFLSVLTDITDRRRFEMELRNSEERYRAIVESQQELICRYKPDMTLTYVNPAYSSYFGKTENELIGESWLTLVPEDQWESLRRHVNDLIQSSRSVTYEHQVVAANGEIQWQQWTDQVLQHEGGNGVEIQSVGVDITELKRAQMRLETALARERELGELKSRFVSMTSHEFRTPLASIRATSETLRDFYERMTDVERQKRFERINTQIDHMAAMLDDILLIGRLEEGQIRANFEQFNLCEFMTGLLDELRVVRLTHQVIYQCDLSDVEIHADPKLIRQILSNLLNNASQYSAPDSRIDIRVYHEDQQAVIEVQDEGIGIPDADQKHLFTAFHRAENVGNIKGTGLGLAIAKRAAELHTGTIDFVSHVGVGTTFTVRIPIEQPSASSS